MKRILSFCIGPQMPPTDQRTHQISLGTLAKEVGYLLPKNGHSCLLTFFTDTPYGDAMRELDSAIGRILDKIRDEPALNNNTLVIFTSDNGPSITGRGIIGNKFTYFVNFNRF